MGVHGLTTFVRQNSSLRRHVTLPDERLPPQTALVIDGLAFMFYIGLHQTLRGGDYIWLTSQLNMYIDYFRRCGLEPEFVFDGPSGSQKHDTVRRRAQQSLDRNIRYMMQLSDEERQLVSEIGKASKLPLLTQGSCVATLKNLGVAVHFAEGEADSPTAELAHRRTGFVASNDSDYFIFPATCRGYVPFNNFEYGPNRSSRLTANVAADEAVLTLGAYVPADLARLLMISPHRLPLFAALLGNDLAHFDELLIPQHRPRFPGFVDSPRDPLRIARTISSTASHLKLAAAAQQCIERLGGSQIKSQSRLSEITDAIVSSAQSYELQALDTPMESFILNPKTSDNETQARCRALYRQASAQGRFNQFVLNMMTLSKALPASVAEVIERQSPPLYIGRLIREIIYAFLHEAIGLESSSITEFVRKGTYLVEEAVQVQDPKVLCLSNLKVSLDYESPLLLQPASLRLSTLTFQIMQLPREASFDQQYLAFILALRHVQSKTKQPWSDHELLSAIVTAVLLQSNPSLCLEIESTSKLNPGPPKDWIFRSSELVTSLFYLQALVETLLLTDQVRPTYLFFEGTLFHNIPTPSSALSHKPSLSVLIRTSTVPNSPASSTNVNDDGTVSPYVLPDVDPIDSQVFRGAQFDASEFLLTRRHTALDELRSELRAYQATLKSQLIAVINTEYEAFIGLSIGLRQANVSQSLATIKRPVLSIKSEVTRVKHELETMRSDVSHMLDERTRVREAKTALKRLLETEEAVDKVEGLLKIGSAATTNGGTVKEQTTIDLSIESPARRLERIASAYSHMLYLVSKAGDMPFIKTLEPRISQTTTALHLDLDKMLSDVLLNQNTTQTRDSLTSLLRTYASLGSTTAAEEVVRKTIIAPRVIKLVSREALGSTADDSSIGNGQEGLSFYSSQELDVPESSSNETQALATLYNRILNFIQQDCALVLDVAERSLNTPPTINNYSTDLSSSVSSLNALVEESSTTNDERSKRQFFILTNVLWDEIGNRLIGELGSTIFAAGRPGIFHAHYTLSMQFLSRLENLCPTVQHLEILRSNSTYASFIKRFQLAVYFQLRLKELVSLVERAFSVGSVSGGGNVFAMSESDAVYKALTLCWNDQVWLEELSGRFWRMTLQLLSRYRTWIDSVVPKYVAPNGNNTLSVNGGPAATNGSRTSFDGDRTRTPSRPSTPGQANEDMSEDATLRQLTVLVADIRLMVSKVRELYRDRIKDRLPAEEQGDQVDHSALDIIESSLSQLNSIVPPLSSQIVTILVRRCSEHLKHVRSVASQVRASTRKGPQEPSFFVLNILKELRTFLNGSSSSTVTAAASRLIDDELRREWATNVAEEVASRYATILSTQKKTEDSYRWYKKGRQGLSFFGRSTTPAPTTDEGEGQDGDKVRMQMQLDANTLKDDARSLGVDVDQSEPFRNLITAISDGGADDK
ncbi:hypothetical protein OIO90_006273 [Microbotryomycetes sp. JL221]|nr:hypothetical protein OIO90_006273 [Microbotryomycetes sp. JL221]